MSKPVLAVAGRLRTRVEAGKRVPRIIGDDDRSLRDVTRVAFGARPSGAAVDQGGRLGAAVDQRHYLPLWVDLLDYDGESALDTVEPAGAGARRLARPAHAGAQRPAHRRAPAATASSTCSPAPATSSCRSGPARSPS